MDYLSSFDISFVGLKNGIHNFQYKIDDRFFEKFNQSPISEGSFEVELVLEKKSTMLVLDFRIAGVADIICARCLRELKLPLKDDQEFIIKFGDETTDPVDNIMVISPTEHKLNVAQHIYEFINLMVPARTICKDTNPKLKCDAEIIEKLKSLSSPKEQNLVDPRWEQLNKYKTK